MTQWQATIEGLAQARDRFFVEGRDPGGAVAPHISRSWQRCRPVLAAADAPAPMPLPHLHERRERSMRLLECAQPELESLAEHVLGEGCVVILTDDSGLILDEIGSAEFMPKARRVALAPGVDWSEGHRGTNAIGTALVERTPLLVLGAEHLLPQNGALGCAAAPIFTGRGEVAGALDISGESMRVDGHALGLVRMAAAQVEHRMLLADARGRLLRFHRRPELIGTAREGLVVVEDGRIVAANRMALSLLGQRWDALIDEPVERVTGTRHLPADESRGLLTLPGGQQIALAIEVPRGERGRGRLHPAGTAMVERAPAATESDAPGASPPVQGRAPDRPAGPTAGADATAAGDAAAGVADAVEPLLRRAARVLDEGLPVLVTGETGVGKDVFARRLHGLSRRRGGPLVAVNCAALPETLIEAELFGYEEGAFTGARRHGSRGRLREAHGGVLFLDEIGDMPLELQTRLLRVLEERRVTPLGGTRAVPVEFDLVCATHRPLDTLVAEGGFRQDLLYRIDGWRVALPPLRERADRRALIRRLFTELGAEDKGLRLEADTLAKLEAHRWPGNVRELRSVLRAVVALAEPGDRVMPEDLPASVRASAVPEAAAGPTSAARPAAGMPAAGAAGERPPALDDITRAAMDRALDDCGGRVAEAARRLGVHRSTLYRHLAQRRLAD